MASENMITDIEKKIEELNNELKELKAKKENELEKKVVETSINEEQKNEKGQIVQEEVQNVKVSTQGISSTDTIDNLAKIHINQDFTEHLDREVTLQRSLEEKIKPLILSVSSSKISRETSQTFNEKQLIRTVSDVPRFFTCVPIVKATNSFSTSVSNQMGMPKYLANSVETFKYGVAEVRVKLESSGFSRKISFDPFQVSEISKIISKNTIGSFGSQVSRLTYTSEAVKTIFNLAHASQVVVILPKEMIKYNGGDKRNDTDYVRTYGMLENKFIDQDVPILPAGTFQHPCQYFIKRVQGMFNLEKNRMRIGELNTSTLYNVKVSSLFGCITDQYFSSMNELYLNDLRGRRGTVDSYQEQYNILTFPSSSIEIDNIQEFNINIIPTLTRRECDGTMMMYILDPNRQKQYLLNLRDLFRETNLIGFYSNDQLLKLPHIFACNDGNIKKILNSVMGLCDRQDVYETLSVELSTTWINCRLTSQMKLRTQEPVDCLFSVLCVILWFNMFPSIAVGDEPHLMFVLFENLKTLIKTEALEYLNREGFAIVTTNRDGPGIRHAAPVLYSREEYFSGRIRYPFSSDRPGRVGIIQRIHDAIQLTHIEHRECRDSGFIQIPRMRDVRSYTLPWNWMAMRLNEQMDENLASEASARMDVIINIILSLATSYKTYYSSITSKSTLGTSSTKPVELISFLNQMPQELIRDMSLRLHCEVNKLRELGEHSIYVPDDTYDGSLIIRKERPRLASAMGDRPFNLFMSNRYEHELKFEIPLYFFFAVRGCCNDNERVVPDATRQFINQQVILHEGRTFGDILGYVNRIKYGGNDPVTRELYDITRYLTSVTVRDIMDMLSTGCCGEFSNIFKLVLNNITVLVDARGKRFQIILSEIDDLLCSK